MLSLFNLWTRCHMWVEFVGCLLHSEKFELAIICFLLLYPRKPLVQERMKSLFVLGSLTIHALACELWIWILWLVRVMLASVKHILIFKRERERKRETGCSFLESDILMWKCYYAWNKVSKEFASSWHTISWEQQRFIMWYSFFCSLPNNY